MVVLGLLFVFAILAIGLGIVAYISNQRKRAGMNPAGDVTDEPRRGRAV